MPIDENNLEQTSNDNVAESSNNINQNSLMTDHREHSPSNVQMGSPLKVIKEKTGRANIDKKRIHPVTGYTDSENMWMKIGNLEKDLNNTNKYPNKRSQYIVQVNDKIFKLRKNPAYTGILDLPELAAEDNKSNDHDDLDLDNDEGKDGDEGAGLAYNDAGDSVDA